MKKYLFVTVGVLFFFFAFGLYKVKERKEELNNLEKPKMVPYTVSLIKPQKGKLKAFTTFRAKYEPIHKGVLAPKTSGIVQKLSVREGDTFKRGEVLAVVDPTDLKAQLNTLTAKAQALEVALGAAKLFYETQKSIYERNLKLYETGGISKEELQLSESSLKRAEAQYMQTLAELKSVKAQIEELKHNLENYSKIKAPYDGVIRTIYAKEGSFVPAGRPVLEIENTDLYRLVASIPTDVKVGKTALVEVGDKKYTLEVDKVLPSAQNGLKKVVIYTKRLNIPSESWVNVKIETGECKGYTVPSSALLYLDGGTYLVNEKKKLIPVKVEFLSGNSACVTGKIPPEERFIVAGQFRLRQIALYKYPIRVKGK
ncbi:MAG TPA: efflux RND transporter periplasmic adaptor subunit [Aquifex aeolicus]|nr:efflux RND transporter periplasmic adaptor subunit [Aquificales bacterium]HIQ26313.1 efflux RND transporter periplasmic adaptor subunit [Aquifex aeolicus]